MNNPHDEIRTYLERLVHRYLNTESMNRLLNDIAQWNVPGRREALELGAHFFQCVTYGLWRIILVELAMLLSDREQRSLLDWLKKTREHAASVRPTRYNPAYPHGEREPLTPKEYCDIVDDQLGRIAAQQNVINRIKTQRDKAIAHLDKSYFDDPEAILNDYPLSDADVGGLMGLVKAILETHYGYLFGSDLEITVHSVRTVNTVLNYARAFIRVREDSALMEKSFMPAKYLSDAYGGSP